MIVDNPSPLGENWIKDDNGVYLWNPEPQEGERITWSGSFVQDGNYKFAEGTGVVKWYNKNGEIVQTDESTFKHGQRHGKFKHTFKSGNVEYINWENGKVDAAEVYVGSYSDGTSVYLLTNTVLIRNYRPYSFNCRVRAGYDLLSYNFYPVNGSPYYRNSEGYEGYVNGGASPVALNIYRYVVNNY